YVMLGGVVAAFLFARGIPLAAAVAIAVFVGALLGALQERLTLAPVRRSADFIQITITLGVAVVLRGMALIAFGKDPLSMPGFSGDGVFEVAGAVLPLQSLWVWGATAALLAAMFFFLMHSDAGRA